MYTIKTLNKISERGLARFDPARFAVSADADEPDGILVRSADMHSIELPRSVRAIARAGAGVNNIPVDLCSDRGIVVFNTPGANANSVKELVLCGMLLASRDIHGGIAWVKSLAGTDVDVATAVEKEKSRFAGPEILGKKLGVVGLGAIGVLVANAADALGMEVIGYDPYISVDSAWGLSKGVRRARSLESLLAEVDFLTLHVPQNDNTKGMINADTIQTMKEGVRIMNFARGGLVKTADIISAVRSGHVAGYVTDFPDQEMIAEPRIFTIPHLGASTPEAEENCAEMAVRQMIDFLESGVIRNAVNFPECVLDRSGAPRLLIANRNIPNMVGQITTILAKEKLNILDMINRHRGEYAYNIIDIKGELSPAAVERIREIDGVIMVRALEAQ